MAIQYIPVRDFLVLVADDDPDIRRTGVKMLSRRGYPTTEARTAAETWDLLQSNPNIRGLVIDNDLGDTGDGALSGYNVLERMMASDQSRLRDMPFILHSSAAGRLGVVDVEGVERLGGIFVPKPDLDNQYLHAVDKVFGPYHKID